MPASSRTLGGQFRSCFAFVVPLFLYTTISSAQSRPDSLSQRPDEKTSKPGFSLIFDNRNSFLNESAVKIFGINAGLKFRNKYRVGVGAYGLRKDYTDLYFYSKRRNLMDTLSPELKLFFITPNFTYTLYNSRWIELSIPLEIGVGKSHYTLRTNTNRLVREEKGLFVPAEAGLAILVKPTPWIGFSLSAGYRKSLLQTDFRQDFDGWYYSYRINLFLGNIISDWRQVRLKKRQKLSDPPPSITYRP